MDALQEHVVPVGRSIVLVPASGFSESTDDGETDDVSGALTLIAWRPWDVRVLTSPPMRVG
jgi:hypothetical protein